MKKNSFVWKNRVQLILRGPDVERFLFLCQSHGITIRNVVKEQSEILCEMEVSDFFSSKKYLQKTHTKVRVVSKLGISFWLKRHKQVPIFIFVCICIGFGILFLNNRLWDIYLEGVDQNHYQQLIQILQENKIYIGCDKENINYGKLEQMIRDQIESITWVSVSQKGAQLVVLCKQNDCPEPNIKFEQKEAGKSIICPKDGKLLKLFVRNGFPTVHEGDAVFAGEILVSGCIPVGEEEMGFIGIDADADYQLEYHDRLLLHEKYEYQNIQETGSYLIYPFLQVGDICFSFTYPKSRWNNQKENREVISMNDGLENRWGRLFPIQIGYVRVNEIIENSCRYTDDDLIKKIEEEMNQKLVILEEKGVQIIEKNVTIESNYEGITCICDLTLREMISNAKMEYGAISDGF